VQIIVAVTTTTSGRIVDQRFEADVCDGGQSAVVPVSDR